MISLVLGASAGVGRSLAESLARIGDDLVLVASDDADLQALAAHIRCVYGCQVFIAATDAACPQRCVDDISAALQGFATPDRLFFPVGISSKHDQGILDASDATRLLHANLTVVISVVGRFLPGIIARGSGNIVGFGSVAAVRGRSSNVVYAAAKRGLESYFESLRHLTASTGVQVVYYRLGYIDSQQSFGQKLLFPKASPNSVSDAIVRNLCKRSGFQTYPWYWSLIGLAVSLVPWPIFKRMRF